MNAIASEFVLPADPATLVLAGGGNRCWWQAGLLSALRERGLVLPPELTGTSAGAAVAAAVLTDTVDAALESCRRLYSSNATIFRWRSLLSRRLEFAHQSIYPAWISDFLTPDGLARLRQGPSRLLVAVTRPAPVLGLAGSVALGTLAYLVDKKLQSLHPRLPRWLGLRLEFLALPDGDIETAHRLLCAAAAPPPIMPAQRLGGRPAFDGGYTDNAPLPPRAPAEGSRSLTLLTRHYPDRPTLFSHGDRWYWQPSRPVPVSTWDCTFRATVDEAYALGRSDALAWLAGQS